jgi:hypothetical protein
MWTCGIVFIDCGSKMNKSDKENNDKSNSEKRYTTTFATNHIRKFTLKYI